MLSVNCSHRPQLLSCLKEIARDDDRYWVQACCWGHYFVSSPVIRSPALCWPVSRPVGIRWLRRSDPDGSRSSACWIFYLATGCWKGAAAALATIGLFVVIVVLTGQNPDMEEFVVTMITLICGVCLCTVAGVLAIRTALKRQIRVWVHPRLYDFLDTNLSQTTKRGRPWYGVNHAIFVVATTLFFPYLATVTGMLIVVAGNAGARDADITAGLILTGLLVAGPLALLPVYIWLSSRVIAQSPHECWPEGLLTSRSAGLQTGDGVPPANRIPGNPSDFQ